jgi:hypothetical protein
MGRPRPPNTVWRRLSDSSPPTEIVIIIITLTIMILAVLVALVVIVHKF